ncbi:MAG: hypothetical protein WBN22_01100 [Verrucomicrobiia bacterium]
MNVALAIAQIIIPLLPTLGGDVVSLIDWINSIRSAAQQTGEWTPAMDQAFHQALVAAGQTPAWTPDPAAGVASTPAASSNASISQASAPAEAQISASEPKTAAPVVSSVPVGIKP